MPTARHSTVLALPENVRNALNARLRDKSYGGFDESKTWLLEQGYAISRSALGRYGRRLKAAEAVSGVDAATFLTVHLGKSRARASADRRAAIMVELVELQRRQTDLLDELSDLAIAPIS